MTRRQLNPPLPYGPHIEQPEPHEDRTAAKLRASIRSIQSLFDHAVLCSGR